MIEGVSRAVTIKGFFFLCDVVGILMRFFLIYEVHCRNWHIVLINFYALNLSPLGSVAPIPPTNAPGSSKAGSFLTSRLHNLCLVMRRVLLIFYPGLTGGAIMLIIFFSVMPAYFIFGFIINQNRFQKQGRDAIPQGYIPWCVYIYSGVNKMFVYRIPQIYYLPRIKYLILGLGLGK